MLIILVNLNTKFFSFQILFYLFYLISTTSPLTFVNGLDGQDEEKELTSTDNYSVSGAVVICCLIKFLYKVCEGTLLKSLTCSVT